MIVSEVTRTAADDPLYTSTFGCFKNSRKVRGSESENLTGRRTAGSAGESRNLLDFCVVLAINGLHNEPIRSVAIPESQSFQLPIDASSQASLLGGPPPNHGRTSGHLRPSRECEDSY